MTHAKTLLFIALGLVTVVFLAFWIAAIRRSGREGRSVGLVETAIGFVANFFDTLGIGSFATTTAMYRLRKLVPDEKIPGTLNVGHALPTIAQAFIYIAIVEVEMKTLILLIVASVLGMWLGAGVVSKLPRRKIQIGMGVALLVAAALTLRAILNADSQTPDVGTTALDGWRLWAGVFGNFSLGALMSLGIGLYGPCMVMISLLGMNPTAAFPIMMGSCAFLMPIGSEQFIRKGSYSLRAAIGLALGGIPAVLIAAYIIKSMDLLYVRWLVVIVVVYTAVMLLNTARNEWKAARA